jgi:glycerophosphoryl diester phosphodiesterase
VISFDFATLHTVQILEPSLQTCALVASLYLSRFDVRRHAAAAVADLAAQGFRAVGVKHTWLTEPLMRALQAGNMGVGVWTINDAPSIRKFVAMGVGFIASDRPDLLGQLLP